MLLSLLDPSSSRGFHKQQFGPADWNPPVDNTSAFDYVQVFSGPWPDPQNRRALLPGPWLHEMTPLMCMELHVHFLRAIRSCGSFPAETKRFGQRDGFLMVRECHPLSPLISGNSVLDEAERYVFLLEHRVSLSFQGVLQDGTAPIFSIVSLHDGDQHDNCYGFDIFELDENSRTYLPRLVPCEGRAAGLCVFQGMIWKIMLEWEKKWVEVLDALDLELRIEVWKPWRLLLPCYTTAIDSWYAY